MAEILSGDLASLRLIDILRVLNQNSKTGRLHLTQRSDVGEIYFRGGEIVHARCRDHVGEDAVYMLLAWSKGKFIFSPQMTCAEKTSKATTKEILALGESIDKEWDSIRDVIPSSDTIFGRAEEPPADFRLADLEAAILREINGQRTVLDIAEQVHADELEVSRAMRKLFLLGLIENVSKGDRHGLEIAVDLAVFDIMQAELTKSIGPIAPIILQEQIERMGETQINFPKQRLAELAELISREIPSEPRQIRFQQVMVQLLKKV